MKFSEKLFQIFAMARQMGWLGIPHTDACRVEQCMAALRVFYTTLPVFVLHDMCMYLRQDCKFSSNLLSSLISRTYQHIRTWMRERQELEVLIYISACSVLPCRFQFITIGYSRSRISTVLD